MDDSATHRSLVRVFLTGKNFEFVEADRAARALEILKTATFHLIITDLNMPDMDGVAFITNLRQEAKTREVPVVLLTAEKERSYRDRGLAAGATVCCLKPVSQAGLMEVVTRHLRIR